MKVFVAGASGVIGRHIVPLLTQAGHEVTGMTRSAERAEGIRAQGADAVVCDAFDSEGVRAAVVAAAPDAVIHELTELPSALVPRKFKTQLAPTNRLRREGTRNLLDAARAAGVDRVLAQSIAFAYAPEGDWVKDEDARLAIDAPPPMDAAISAIADLEQQVLEFRGVVLRYGYFYGPGTQFAPGGFYDGLARKRQLPVLGSGEGRWSFIHVADAAAATVAALEHASPGVYNIVDDEPAPTREWVPAYAASVGAKRPLTLPAWIGRLVAGRIAVSGMTEARAASNAKAKRELAWSPQHASWRDGFRIAAG